VDLFNQNLEFHKIDLVDAAPLLYLRDLLTGSGRNQAIAHLFIDEMQDYTLPQLMYLKYIFPNRSEEHTSELQSRFDLVCRLLLYSSSFHFRSFPTRRSSDLC